MCATPTSSLPTAFAASDAGLPRKGPPLRLVLEGPTFVAFTVEAGKDFNFAMSYVLPCP